MKKLKYIFLLKIHTLPVVNKREEAKYAKRFSKSFKSNTECIKTTRLNKLTQ